MLAVPCSQSDNKSACSATGDGSLVDRSTKPEPFTLLVESTGDLHIRGAIQGLNLALLVHIQHHSALERV